MDSKLAVEDQPNSDTHGRSPFEKGFGAAVTTGYMQANAKNADSGDGVDKHQVLNAGYRYHRENDQNDHTLTHAKDFGVSRRPAGDGGQASIPKRRLHQRVLH